MLATNVVLQLFDYDKDRGVLLWKDHFCTATKNRYKGREAGTIGSNGYRRVMISGKTIRTASLIWLLEHGEWHKTLGNLDGNKLNTKIDNLRTGDNRCFFDNRMRHRKDKLLGASYNKNARKWQSTIQVRNNRLYLGLFDTEQEAHEKYLKARETHGV